MQKVALVALAVMVVFAFAGCGGDAGKKAECKSCHMSVPADKVCPKDGNCAMCDKCVMKCEGCKMDVKAMEMCPKCHKCKTCDKCSK